MRGKLEKISVGYLLTVEVDERGAYVNYRRAYSEKEGLKAISDFVKMTDLRCAWIRDKNKIYPEFQAIKITNPDVLI
jgi:hypothetical protein